MVDLVAEKEKAIKELEKKKISNPENATAYEQQIQRLKKEAQKLMM